MGSKLQEQTHRQRAPTGFRRTLVGSKHALEGALLDDYGPVSDGPLWGRSELVHAAVGLTPIRFRRTLVGSKRGLYYYYVTLKFVFQTDPCGVEAFHQCGS